MIEKELELIEKILEKIDSMNSSVNELNKEVKELGNEVSVVKDGICGLGNETKSLLFDMNELKEVTNKRFSEVHEKLDNIIEINNKINLKG